RRDKPLDEEGDCHPQREKDPASRYQSLHANLPGESGEVQPNRNGKFRSGFRDGFECIGAQNGMQAKTQRFSTDSSSPLAALSGLQAAKDYSLPRMSALRVCLRLSSIFLCALSTSLSVRVRSSAW